MKPDRESRFALWPRLWSQCQCPDCGGPARFYDPSHRWWQQYCMGRVGMFGGWLINIFCPKCKEWK